jgi:hypothetical protein
MREAKARGSAWGTRYPVRPCRTESRSPGLSDAIDGVPQAAASTLVITSLRRKILAHARQQARFSARPRSGTDDSATPAPRQLPAGGDPRRFRNVSRISAFCRAMAIARWRLHL